MKYNVEDHTRGLSNMAKRRKKGGGFGCLVIVVFVIAIIGGLSNSGGPKNNGASRNRDDSSVKASTIQHPQPTAEFVVELPSSESTKVPSSSLTIDNSEPLALSVDSSGLSNLAMAANAEGSTLTIGDNVNFGVFEQDQNTENGPEPIEWQVVSIVKGNAVLLSQYVLEYMPYNEAGGDVTWENSTIRRWLNDEFYSDAFTSIEKEIIGTCKLVNDTKSGNPAWQNVSGGGKTSDNVFFLSYRQAETYLDDAGMAIGYPTKYAVQRGAEDWLTSASTWWLRSPGSSQDEGCLISAKGLISSSNTAEKQGIRPAICVSLTKASAANIVPEISQGPTPAPAPKVYNASLLQGIHGFEYARGSKGDAVKYIQQMLIDQSFLPTGQADGSFGAKTEAAIIEFQNKNGLNPTGIADISTQYMLAEQETGFEQIEGREYEYAGLTRFGVYRFDGGIFIGMLRNDQSYQEGTQIFDGGIIYIGSFKNNQRNGKGEAWYPNGDYYTGNWQNDLMNGKGVYHFGSEDSIEQYDGEWVDGTMSGKGTYTLADGSTIKARWENNQQIGWWK